MEESNNNLKAIQELCLAQTCGTLDKEKVMTFTSKQKLVDYMHSVYCQAVRLLESKYMFG